MTILYYYCPDQEIYSIDECFLDVTGILNGLTEYVFKMRHSVFKWAGIALSAGIQPSHYLK